ncbi:MFS transporter [Luteimicrobium subarcticum]|uniref:Putative MFS family arabinose efflux permease n=1 Tax=Luteimicrobium subarcticum TaxID=620910 RepID=A0A2M8WWD8_9MICO|nr:MFS transporter [Luteimicrobium subarcticum]PJI95240.1 putative MFS family arabinose efflux permease [Luteimicrobium subarcticum]
MGMRGYREVLRDPQIRRLVLVAMVARIPNTASALVLTLHVVQTLHQSYASAGVVAAASTIGMAAGSPWRGRLVDKFGLRRAVWPSVVAAVVLWPLMAFLPYPALVVAALVCGLFAMPIFTVVRKSLSVLVPIGRQRTAYALDSIANELVFMVGPAVGVGVATQVGTVPVMITIGIAVSAAGSLLLVLDPPTRLDQVGGVAGGTVPAAVDAHHIAPDPEHDRPAPLDPDALAAGQLAVALDPTADTFGTPARRAWRAGLRRLLPPWMTARVLMVLAASLGTTLVLVGTDLAILAQLRADGEVGSLGVVYFTWCLGSVVGAVVYGARHRPIDPMVLLLGLGVLTVPMLLAHSVPALAVLAFIAGLPCASVMTATAEEIARIVREDRRGEAMGWQGTAFTVGSAVGAPVLGVVLDASGPWAAYVAAGGCGALIAVVGLLVGRRRRSAASAAQLRF